MKIAVIGAGRWGGTLATFFQKYGHDLTLICQDWELEKHQKERLVPRSQGFKIPNEVKITANKEQIHDAEVVFLAIPGKYFEEDWNEYKDCISGTIINASKMIDQKDGRLVLPHRIVNRKNYYHLGSAAFPDQLLREEPTMGTIYSRYPKFYLAGPTVQESLSTRILRLYYSDDLVGGELASALKNVIAIAIGIIAKLGYGECTQATVISRGAYEIRSFSSKHGANPATFDAGTTSLTDLIATCASSCSHNRTAGSMITSFSKEVIETQIGTVEGFHTLSVLSQIPKAFELMPIAKATYQVVFEQFPPMEAFGELLNRPLKGE